MKQILIGIFILCFCFISQPAKSQNSDSLSFSAVKKNTVEVEFLGNDYLSPFSSRGFLPFSINYSRLVVFPKLSLQFTIGLTSFRSYYYEHQGIQSVLHRPWSITIPTGFLCRGKYKRNGLWFGLFFTSAYVKQIYSVPIDRNSSIVYTIHYDYQIMPNVCYQFHSKKGDFVCKIFYSPKIASGAFKRQQGYDWTIFPLWGGISIGGGW